MELKLTLQLGHDNIPVLPKEKAGAKKKQINFSKKYLINHTVKGKIQHNTQTNIYSFISLPLHVSVSVDHLQYACSYRLHQLNNMWLRPRHNNIMIMIITAWT